ncbi:MAG: 5-methyltetrahydropteroyltriglutamate--homocysteine S-methyltransferase [Burkholderiaceae bacterium]|nr:MAG: 5-methyltetrahydropteroyltriglutamate--homocysteine S-methyltransferase [Burkholderiaceae bacterium]
MKTHILGLPRIGPNRELKFALESFWKGELDEAGLQQVGAQLRRHNWQRQIDAGLDFITVGDFAWYDHVLQTLARLGGLPARFANEGSGLQQLFACARGTKNQFAMEMTKWFDTNYHYLVPEYAPDSDFSDCADDLLAEIREAQQLGRAVKPVLVGPLTLLYLGKEKQGLENRLSLLPRLLTAYSAVLQRLQAAGVEWVQIDEPVLTLELAPEWRAAFTGAYAQLAAHAPKILLVTYFDAVEDIAACAQWPVAGWHIDLVRAPSQLAAWLTALPQDHVLSCGVVDGRNVWRCDADRALEKLRPAQAALGERLWIASSCSLLHAPVDLAAEKKLNLELRNWLAFGQQKIEEVALLKQALLDPASVADRLQQARDSHAQRQASGLRTNAIVQQRLRNVRKEDAARASSYAVRIEKQRVELALPLFPTTTIGSFPQTGAIRAARAAYKRGQLGHLDYLQTMRAEIKLAIEKQEAYGLDLLVHGEAERNDMVEYFGELLWGYAFTENGWVQSYGSRCVKPPIIYGDVYRPEAMTVSWTQYAQSLTAKPVKGMLTGPITMLQWAFVRDDQPRADTALQIALAIRDEVCDLEAAGIRVIQIDEPAIREGLPLKRSDWTHYLQWAVRAFQISAAGVSDATQIHTHMCYAEFNDILDSIAAMDADVITIETSRSDMELLRGFQQFEYPNDIGPGVYDIHSPRVPQVREMERLLEKAAQVIPAERLWVNPDCGLKTRGWEEVDAGLVNMVAAAKNLRQRYAE